MVQAIRWVRQSFDIFLSLVDNAEFIANMKYHDVSNVISELRQENTATEGIVLLPL